MNEDVDVNEDGTEVPETPEYSDIELRALDMGWRPKEEFQGSEDDFIDAKEFVRRKPLFEKIEGQSKQIKAVTKALEALKVHYTRVEQAAVEKAINTMKQQRKVALSDGDGEQFELIDDEIKKAESQLAQIEQVKNAPLVEEENVHPEWKAFTDRNPWYTSTGYMKTFADQIGSELAAQGIAPAEVLRQVEQAVRKEFPAKFTNPRKNEAPDVEAQRGTSNKRVSSEENSLSEVERKIMNDLVRSGVMTKEKYLADLKAVKNRN